MGKPGDVMPVHFGALVPSLTEQGFDDEDGHLQSDVDAIARLSVRGLLSASETDKARRRVIKRLRVLRLDQPANDKAMED